MSTTALMKKYFCALLASMLLLANFPMIVVLFGLFFYETFSALQVFLQGSIQLALFTAIYLSWIAMQRLLKGLVG